MTLPIEISCLSLSTCAPCLPSCAAHVQDFSHLVCLACVWTVGLPRQLRLQEHSYIGRETAPAWQHRCGVGHSRSHDRAHRNQHNKSAKNMMAVHLVTGFCTVDLQFQCYLAACCHRCLHHTQGQIALGHHSRSLVAGKTQDGQRRQECSTLRHSKKYLYLSISRKGIRHERQATQQVISTMGAYGAQQHRQSSAKLTPQLMLVVLWSYLLQRHAACPRSHRHGGQPFDTLRTHIGACRRKDRTEA